MSTGVPHNAMAMAADVQPSKSDAEIAVAMWLVREERDRLRVENARLRADLAAIRAGQLTLEVA